MNRRRLLVVAALLAILPAALFVGGWLAGLRLNVTPSYPLGLWRIVPLHRDVAVGDLIFICPPQSTDFDLARMRGYLRSGLCPGWFSPLIKTVVAVSGQRVEVATAVTVDGTRLAHSDVRRTDAEGRLLPVFAGGVVPSGQVFLHSNFAGSYDSRYFGPIPAAGVLGLAQPLLVLDP
jgi:conjugative transfer signal peptidase TraF